MKINCIIDTNSCVYLSKVLYLQKSLLKHLSTKANLNYSPEVSKELIDHRPKGIETLMYKANNKTTTARFTIDNYEVRMIVKKSPSRQPTGNKGEIDNFVLSVDQIHHVKKNSIMFITDDKKAMNGVLSDWLGVFPVISFWNSFDVILYLYGEGIIKTRDDAFGLIRSVISISAPKVTDRSEKYTTTITKTYSEYGFKLDQVKKLIF